MIELEAILEGTCSTQMGAREWIDWMSFRSSTPSKVVAEVLMVLKRKKI